LHCIACMTCVAIGRARLELQAALCVLHLAMQSSCCMLHAACCMLCVIVELKQRASQDGDIIGRQT
jgi:hypothetical protein